MKRIQDDLDLRNAFSPAPEDVKDMLIRTANSVKEEEKVRKYSWGAVLLAAVIIMATMSVGLAASELVGWTDFFSRFHGINLPKEAQEIMSKNEHQSYQVGPLTLTVQELLCDGENAFTSIVARTADGSPAIICSQGEWMIPMRANGSDTEVQRLGVDGMMTWEMAAKTLGQPLYGVRAIPEVDFSLLNGEQMEDYLHDAEGGFVDFSMVPVKPGKVGDTLPVIYYLYVEEIDVETGEIKQQWTQREQSEIPVVSSVLAEKTYTPASECLVNGFKLESVKIDMHVTGGYVTLTFTAPDGVPELDRDWAWHEIVDAVTLADADGNPYKSGISMTVKGDVYDWPTVVIEETLSMTELPESLQIITRNQVEETVKLK